MAEGVPESGGRSGAAAWRHEHLLVRRTVPFAVLAAWGIGAALWAASRPEPTRMQTYQGAVPVFTVRGDGADYYQFWIVGRARETLHPDNIYSMDNRRRMAEWGGELLRSDPEAGERLAACVQKRKNGIETFSTPFLYAAVNLFASGSYDCDYERYTNLSLVAMLFAVVVVSSLLGFSLAEGLLFAAATVVWCEPLASDIRVGNVNQFQFAGLALYLLTRTRTESAWMDLLGGLVLGFLVAFKPTLAVLPVFLALAWAIDRRWTALRRQALAAIAAAAVAFVAGCLYLNSWSAWTDWARALPDLDRVSNISVGFGNFSLVQVILEAAGNPDGGGAGWSVVLLLALLAAAGVALHRTRPAGEAGGRVWRERDIRAAALGAAAAVLVLQLVWVHYFILAVPLLLCVLRPGAWMQSAGASGRLSRSRRAMAGLALSFLALLAVFGKPLIVLFQPGLNAQLVMYIGGAWGLMLLGLAGLWQPAPAANASSESAQT